MPIWSGSTLGSEAGQGHRVHGRLVPVRPAGAVQEIVGRQHDQAPARQLGVEPLHHRVGEAHAPAVQVDDRRVLGRRRSAGRPRRHRHRLRLLPAARSSTIRDSRRHGLLHDLRPFRGPARRGQSREDDRQARRDPPNSHQDASDQPRRNLAGRTIQAGLRRRPARRHPGRTVPIAAEGPIIDRYETNGR